MREKRTSHRRKVSPFLKIALSDLKGKYEYFPNLVDISDTGLSFDLEESTKLKPLEQAHLQIYLSDYDFVQIRLKLMNIAKLANDQWRFGAEFCSSSYESIALYHFIRFLEMLAKIHTPPSSEAAKK